MTVNIVTENAKTGEDRMWWEIQGAGDLSNLGFAREFSVNIGETMRFSCHGTGTEIDIYRIGWYGGKGWRKVTTLTNVPTVQPVPVTVPNSNGAKTCTAWAVTAQWAVPTTEHSGLYVGVFRNGARNNASYIPFIVRDDAATADVVYKTSDSTWALAYNYFGTMAAPLSGKSVYGTGGGFDIANRQHYMTYHQPIVTRQGIPQTYWMACEFPLIRFLERNGISVKYIASKDLDRDPMILDKGKTFLSSGHDEYWSAPMRDHTEQARDRGTNLLFMSANEVFWRVRYDTNRDGFWCYKDTMPGPGSHVGGTALDPVSWTGTWKDTRWNGRKPEHTLTGTDFRMNGVTDRPAILLKGQPYAAHPVWGNSALVDNDLSFPAGVVGFEGDYMRPTQPEGSYKILAAYSQNINGLYADDNGQDYSGNGTLDWGIISQRYLSGAVVVGFGTCQWSWMLDNDHDRGTTVAVQQPAQQFTINLLHDLGAVAATRMSALAAPTTHDLNVYGIIPSADGGDPEDPEEPEEPEEPGEPGEPSAGDFTIRNKEGAVMTPMGYINGVLAPLTPRRKI